MLCSAEATSPNPNAATRTPFKQRAFVACYVAAITIAMLGWLSAFGWAAAEVVKLL